jgi:hypothetical protein
MEIVKITKVNGKSKTLTGVAGVSGNTAGFELMMWSGEVYFYPHTSYLELKRVKMTDEQIKNSSNKAMVAWYEEAEKAYEEQLAKAKAEEEAEAEKRVEEKLEPLAKEDDDVEE